MAYVLFWYLTFWNNKNVNNPGGLYLNTVSNHKKIFVYDSNNTAICVEHNCLNKAIKSQNAFDLEMHFLFSLRVFNYF